MSGNDLNYQSIGSGGGIKQIKAKTVTFGATDAPLTADELAASGLAQWPMVIGGIVPVLNLDGVSAGELTLDGPTLAKIFSGVIKPGTIPLSRSLNSGVKLPSAAIAVVHRSDGSGTTFNFTNYLSKVSPDWKNSVGVNTAVEWPVGIGAKGNEGVANNVVQTKSSIGYVEYAYAMQNKMTYAKMINQAGKTVAPSIPSFQAAAANADWEHAPGFYQILTDEPGANSWPITAATFILMPKAPQDVAAATEALKFFDWAFANGAKSAEELDYNSAAVIFDCADQEDLGIRYQRHRWQSFAELSIAACETLGSGAAPPHWRRRQMKVARRDALVDVAISDIGGDRAQKLAKTLSWLKLKDDGFRLLTLSAAIVVLLILGGVIVSLVVGSLPAIRAFGFDFLTLQTWNPVTEKFGALAAIYGTLVTALIALLVAAPVGVGIAIFLTELCPYILRRPIGIGVELLAGIPSIIYGIWGLFLFAPAVQTYIQPALIAAFGDVPILSTLFAGPPYGIGILTAGFILGIMVIPFVASISRDVFETVPAVLKEAAYGQGCNIWEVVRFIVIPYTRVGVIGGVMLALGRALGETMAVTFVIGNAHRITGSLLAPGTTISATIANEFTEAVGDLYTSALIELGLILFVITFFILAAARLLLMRLERQAGA